MRCGLSPRAAHSSSRFQSSWPCRSRASTLALWMVLWSFVLRGISIEVGGHINDSLWRSGWDFVFAVSNVVALRSCLEPHSGM